MCVLHAEHIGTSLERLMGPGKEGCDASLMVGVSHKDHWQYCSKNVTVPLQAWSSTNVEMCGS